VKKLALIVFVFHIFSCTTNNEAIKRSDDSAIRLNRYDLENDMFLPHEGIPAGVPEYYGWQKGPASTYGINIPSDWNAILAWGQVYADKDLPNPNKDFPLVSVHIKDLQLFIYYDDGSWKMVQNIRDPDGHLYVEGFEDNENKPAAIKKEIGGGISIQAGSGYNFHFYPDKRNIIANKENIKGVFVVCKARLLGAENYDQPPKYLICIGGDYWRNLNARWKDDFSNNNDIAIGRFKYVTPEWQYFTMHTFSEEEVKSIVFPLE